MPFVGMKKSRHYVIIREKIHPPRPSDTPQNGNFEIQRVMESRRDDIILANLSKKPSPPSEGCPQDGVGSFHQMQSDGVDAFITTSPP